MTYKWVIPFKKADANVAGAVCESLENSVGLTSETLLDASRPEDAPLHNVFEWDDEIAGEQYRLIQSRNIIKNLRVITEDVTHKEIETRAFVSLETTPRAKHSFEGIMTVVSNDEKKTALLQIACRDMEAFKRKYGTIVELSDVIACMDIAISKIS